MGNEELIALLESLQGSGAGSDAGRVLNPGAPAQVPSLVAATTEPKPASSETRETTTTSSSSTTPSAVRTTVSSVASSLASSLGLSLGSSLGSPVASSLGSSSGSQAASSVASSALRSLGEGLTLLPVVSSLLKLFGVGKEKEEPPALEKYELPAPIRAEAGLSQSGETFLIDRGVGDRIRQLPAPAAVAPFAGSQAASTQPTMGGSITVNVQAMDSQSFMDRREDIARAVREAMLQSHSLNDVVSEL